MSRYLEHGLTSDKNIPAQIVIGDAVTRGWTDCTSLGGRRGENHEYMRRHLPNTAGCVISFKMLGCVEDGKSGNSLLPRLVEMRMKTLEHVEIEPTQRRHVVTTLSRMLLDWFITELGGEELQQAVINKCYEQGNFASRIKSGEFDCKARA